MIKRQEMSMVWFSRRYRHSSRVLVSWRMRQRAELTKRHSNAWLKQSKSEIHSSMGLKMWRSKCKRVRSRFNKLASLIWTSTPSRRMETLTAIFSKELQWLKSKFKKPMLWCNGFNNRSKRCNRQLVTFRVSMKELKRDDQIEKKPHFKNKNQFASKVYRFCNPFVNIFHLPI